MKRKFLSLFTLLSCCLIFLISPLYTSASSSETTVFTEEELDFIRESSSIRIAISTTRQGLSYYDNISETYKGITCDIIQAISQKSGLNFEIVSLPLGARAIEYLNTTSTALVAPILTSELTSVSDELVFMTLDSMSSSIVLVANPSFRSGTKETLDMVLPVSYVNAEESLSKYYPNASISYLENGNACFDAVSNNLADCTLENIYVAYNRLLAPRYDSLSIISSGEFPEKFHIVTNQDASPLLVSIIQKSLDLITQEELYRIINENTYEQIYHMTLLDFYIQNKNFVLSLFLLNLLALALIIILISIKHMNYVKSQKANEKLEEINHKLLKALKEKDSADMERTRLELQRLADTKYQEELQHLLDVDDLTGLYSRRAFLRMARELLDSNPLTAYCVIYLDVDRFKSFNDNFGTTAGDDFLCYLGTNFTSLASSNGWLNCHLESDHFVFLVPLADFRPDQFVKSLTQWGADYPLNFEFSFSLGIYIVDDHSTEVRQMIDSALQALYEAKEIYGTTYAYYSMKLKERQIHELDIVNSMVSALKNEEFDVYFQPQYTYSEKKLFGAEALVRWIHPEKGIINPGTFIPLFEKNGFIVEIDQYVWEKTCQYLHQWAQKNNGTPPIPVSVNISRFDIDSLDLPTVFSNLLEKYQIPVSFLNLEITESAYVESPEQLLDTVRRLQTLGFTIEMDDFGSGYSSLNSLKDVPVDILKLDLRFLQSENSDRGGNILNSIARMARWLGLPIIAEGVETKQQADFLTSIGCDNMQGYLFSKPLPVPQFEELLWNTDTDSIERTEIIIDNEHTNQFWGTDSQITLLFNNFVGAAAIYEYSPGTVEIIRVNNNYFKVTQIDRVSFNDYRTNLLEHLLDSDKQVLVSTLEHAIETAEDTECEICLQPAGTRLTDLWILLRIHLVARSANSYIFYCIIEDSSKKRELSWQEKRYRIISELTHIMTFDYCVNDDLMLEYIDHKEAGYKEKRRYHYIDSYLDSDECVIDSRDISSFKEFLFQAISAVNSGSFECRANYFGTGSCWIRYNWISVINEGSHVDHVVGWIANIEDEVAIRNMANFDSMTGLFNRSSTEKQINLLLKDPEAKVNSIFALLDIDNFKTINDSFGHKVGDDALEKFGALLKSSCRNTDIVGRIGGDEFILLYRSAPIDTVIKHMNKLLEDSKNIQLGSSATLSMSIGIYQIQETDCTFEEILEKADKALYQAKARGKHCYVLYSTTDK